MRRNSDEASEDFIKTNLRLLQNITAPRNMAEVRSMMEVFGALKAHVSEYDRKARPLQKLL